MYIELAWWDLNEDDPTINTLSENLTNQILEAWETVPNLTTKLWLASEDDNLWGALMIWHGKKIESSKMPHNISANIIGRQPDHRIVLNILHETKHKLQSITTNN